MDAGSGWLELSEVSNSSWLPVCRCARTDEALSSRRAVGCCQEAVMMIDMSADIARLRRLGVTIPEGREMEVAMELFMTYDRGFAAGREHAIGVVQRRATNPMDIVREIRRPIR